MQQCSLGQTFFRYGFVLLFAIVTGCSPSNPGPFIGAGAPISVAIPGGATSLALTNSSPSGTFTVSESGYSGTFTATSSNEAVATVSPASSSSSFTVNAVGGGTTTITVTDSFGGKATVPVGVTWAISVISAR